MSAVLEVTDLSVRFGGVQAVDAVTFELAEQEILGVVGPNGAGKTTMFDAISGFVASTGRVVLEGRDVASMSPERRSRARLGRSFQDAKLFPSLTVFETLAVAFERHIGLQDPVSSALTLPWVRKAERRIRSRVEDLIELMGLGAFRDKFVSELSTGSRRIVDLAVIMAHDPRVLLLDEPSSGIAQRETEALGPLLVRIRDETGASLIVIEHDMPMITSVSDRLLALETGRVLTDGKPADVLNDPRLVAAYLGSDRAVVERSGRAGANGATPPTAKKPVGKKSAAKRATKPTAKKSTKAAPKKTAAKRSAAKRTTKAAPKKTAKKTAAKRRPTTSR
ncbi:MAG: ABC transporter ATP-binding protein [Acidimicrobiales bacterium]